jgi:hypothetical protein
LHYSFSAGKTEREREREIREKLPTEMLFCSRVMLYDPFYKQQWSVKHLTLYNLENETRQANLAKWSY